MYQSFDLLSVSMSNHEDQVISLLEKIKSLSQNKEKIIGRVCELRSHINPKLDIMLSSLQDVDSAMKSKELIDLKSAEALAYLFSGLIIILECLKKGWDSHLNFLNNFYADIFKFL